MRPRRSLGAGRTCQIDGHARRHGFAGGLGLLRAEARRGAAAQSRHGLGGGQRRGGSERGTRRQRADLQGRQARMGAWLQSLHTAAGMHAWRLAGGKGQVRPRGR